MELILAWRNNPLIWQGLYQQAKEDKPIDWYEHWNWWHTRYNWKQFIIQVNDNNIWTRDIGYINIGQLDHWCPEVAIVIGEVSLWGQGIGRQALSLALDWLEELGYQKTHTTILKNNKRSIKLFESLGFQRVGDAREGEWAYEKNLS